MAISFFFLEGSDSEAFTTEFYDVGVEFSHNMNAGTFFVTGFAIVLILNLEILYFLWVIVPSGQLQICKWIRCY